MGLFHERGGVKGGSGGMVVGRGGAPGRTQEQRARRGSGGAGPPRRGSKRRGKLPSQFQEPRTYRTRPSPFAEDWPWIASQLECVFLDDIGYVQHDPAEMEVLFTFLAERYERRSVAISTNLAFSDWNRIFKDPMTTMAAIDRVVNHSVIRDLMHID